MRPLLAVCGVLLTIIGLVAAITAEFNGIGTWFVAAGFAIIGAAGLLSLRTASDSAEAD